MDLNMLFEFVKRSQGVDEAILGKRDFSDIDIDFIKSISVADFYAFITLLRRSTESHHLDKGEKNSFDTPVLEVPEGQGTPFGKQHRR